MENGGGLNRNRLSGEGNSSAGRRWGSGRRLFPRIGTSDDTSA